MANYKVPRVVEIVDALPVNATGKVVKDSLRDRATARRAQDARVSAGPPDGLAALGGLRVVELGVWVAAPAAGALLADWGADVIKVEPPTGDPMRNAFGSLGIGKDFPNPAFAQDNRGKRSVVLDLRQDEAPRASGGAARRGRRLPHQPAPRRPRRPGARAPRHGGPPSAPRLLQRQRVRAARPGPEPPRVRHRRLLGAVGAFGPAGQQRGRSAQCPRRHRRPHQRAGRIGRGARSRLGAAPHRARARRRDVVAAHGDLRARMGPQPAGRRWAG